MSARFDIPIERLSQPSGASVGRVAGPEAKTFYIETFGCQMNVHDSEKVAGLLISRGYRQVEKDEQADLILYNTCSIREKAAQKVFSRLGQFKRDPLRRGGKTIGVLGCVAQQEGERIFERAPWVGLVCGSASYRKLPQLLAELESGNHRVTGLSLATEETFETEFTRRDNPFRAYITIIEGCDKSCAYCVVPMTRGPERSRTSDSVLAEARALVDLGYTEIQLLGQNVNCYRDPSPRKWDFADLLSAVGEVGGVRRVRFTTSHPRDFNRQIVQAIAANPVLCNHVHLPVQSGSTAVLARMKRDYSREQYLEKFDCIRGAKRAISITTDIIVGFPGESEADFEETLSLLDYAQYDSLFSFKYSRRPGTSALALDDAILEEEKGRRLSVLQAHQRAIQERRNQSLMGRRFELLVEGQGREGQLAGRTSCHRIVNFLNKGSINLGDYVWARVTQAGPNSLIGELDAGLPSGANAPQN